MPVELLDPPLLLPPRPRLWEWVNGVLDWMLFSRGSQAAAVAAKTEPHPSLDELLVDHADAIYRVALSIVRDHDMAEDITQDTLIKAWQALPTFRGDASLRNWILRIAHNTAVSTLRRRREKLAPPEELPEPPGRRSVDRDVHERMAMEAFATALDDLDDLSRSIVVLRELEGLSYEAICEVLTLTLPAVKTRLLRARRQLARALEGWEP